ncbi:ABC transporter substrate-binding protein [Rhodopila sp.]|jgi:iron(III) transport system substrate-binding protein|uniref:ABC transporter substrate-binding protein n=1 Tax=Rhodopila sp. TaxID=2480087 RepID=UPI002B90FBA9|nr:extracellular solute-binding protein [Rhodopila sp.]HVZ09518.1 extracellular solute-binding protein [Rhodopila sp.]
MTRFVFGRTAVLVVFGRTAVLAACLMLGGMLARPAQAGDAVCASPRQMDGFRTCADVAKAEAEGSLVLYSPDPEEGSAKLLEAFHKAFPKISTNFIRLQTGALYQKLMTERRAKAFQVDVLQLTDMGYVLDFQKRGGYMQYVSPEMDGFKPDNMSTPKGYWTWSSYIIAGLAYNPKLVKPEDAPKSWKDALEPRWKGVMNAKTATSGLQHVTWYELRKLYGDAYFDKLAALQPRAFDSYVQQFDRMISGQDTIAFTAQYSAYLLAKAKGAPVEFVFPTEGLTATPGVIGLVAEAPHPNAAQLFMDWFLSRTGQIAYDTIMSLNSPRADAPPPPGGKPIEHVKLLYPSDWQDFLQSRPAFAQSWATVTGTR